jgi:hypothetical protein
LSPSSECSSARLFMEWHFSVMSVTICYSTASNFQTDLNHLTSQIFVLCDICFCKVSFPDVNLVSIEACNGLMGTQNFLSVASSENVAYHLDQND